MKKLKQCFLRCTILSLFFIAVACISANDFLSSTLKESFDEDAFYEDYHALSSKVVTPHLKWAKPSVWSPLKILLIAPSWGQREAIELQQRFDFQVSTLMTLRHNAFAGLTAIGSPLSPELVTSYFDRDLLQKNYDAIVVSRTRWALFPSQYRYDLLRKVYEEGTALILINVDKHDELEQLWQKTSWDSGLDFADLSALTYFKNTTRSRNLIDAVSFGKGKVVKLSWRNMSAQMTLTPWGKDYDYDWEYEHYLAITAKTILTAAQAKQNFIISENENIILQSAVTEQILSFNIIENTDESAETLELFAFSENAPDGYKLSSFPVLQGKASGTVNANIPEGNYILLAKLQTAAGELCGWQYFPLEVKTNFSVKTLRLDKDNFAKEGELVSGTIETEGVFDKKQTLRLRVFDINNRLLIQQKLRYQSPGIYKFAFAAPKPLNSCLFRVEVNAGNLSKEKAYFSVQGRERPTFSFGAWVESQSCYISYQYYQTMRENGIDGIFYAHMRGDAEEASFLLAKSGMMSIPHYYHYAPANDKSDPKKPINKNNLNDPVFRNEQRAKMKKLAELWSKYDIHSYTDGSDKSRGGNSFDELSKEKFRIWMQQRYGTITKLNEKLQSNYKDFADLQPQPLDIAREEGKLSLWIEYNRFFEELFLDYFADMLEVAREADLNSEAYLGPDGFGRLDPFEFSGMYELLKTVNYFNLYTYQDPPQMEIARSLLRYSPNVKYRTIYAGSYGAQFMNYEFMRTIPWYMLFHDYTGYFWYMGNGKLSYSSEGCMAFMPDLRPSEGYLVSAQQIQELRQGLDKLVSVSKRHNDKLAILYCNTSVAAATVAKQENVLRQSYSTLQNLLEDSSLQYDYIPGPELDAGQLKGNYSVVFLPYTLSLSKKSLRALEEFVADGGLVVADHIPGKYDDLFCPGPERILAERFADNAKDWLLYDWKSYSKVRSKEKEGRDTRNAFIAMLEPYKQSYTKLQEGGIVNVEKIEYQMPDGGILIALINYQKETKDAQLFIPAGKVLYDIRNEEKLSANDVYNFTLSGGNVKIFAMLDKEINKAKIKKPRTVKTGKSFKMTLNNQKQTNAYRVEVKDSEGMLRKEYCKTILADEEFSFPIALNDPKGNWQITIRDAITGKISKENLKVK